MVSNVSGAAIRAAAGANATLLVKRRTFQDGALDATLVYHGAARGGRWCAC